MKRSHTLCSIFRSSAIINDNISVVCTAAHAKMRKTQMRREHHFQQCVMTCRAVPTLYAAHETQWNNEDINLLFTLVYKLISVCTCVVHCIAFTLYVHEWVN